MEIISREAADWLAPFLADASKPRPLAPPTNGKFCSFFLQEMQLVYFESKITRVTTFL